MRHIVNSLQFETLCSGEEQALKVRQQFAQNCQPAISEVIDRVCTKYAGADEWVRIDRIEIDMGRFETETFERLFTDRFLTEFEKTLRKRIEEIPEEERLLPGELNELDTILYFLTYGVLPWWAEEEQLDIDTRMAELLDQHPGKIKAFLSGNTVNVAVWKRIAYQFNDKVHAAVVELMDVLKVVRKQVDSSLQQDAENAVAPGNEEAYKQKKSQTDRFVLENAVAFLAHPIPSVETDRLIEQFLAEVPGVSIKSEPLFSSPAVIEDKQVQSGEDAIVAQREILLAKLAGAEDNKMSSAVDMQERLMIRYAGVILLGPFLKQLFTELEFLEHSEWKNAEANYRAIHLLRYISSGELKAPEYSLALEKILCGMDIASPIPRDVELSEREKEEAASLLNSVIGNWPALKNTSVNGLRETFLKREGILSHKEDDWLLQVERKTVDVLLESLPWGFSSLAFSWNKNIVFVEW